MSLLTHLMNQAAVVVATETDEYGDQVPMEETPIPCRFRDITAADRIANSETYAGVDATAWFEPSADIHIGSIIRIDERYWRVQSLTQARRLDEEIVFLKTTLKVHEIAEVS